MGKRREPGADIEKGGKKRARPGRGRARGKAVGEPVALPVGVEEDVVPSAGVGEDAATGKGNGADAVDEGVAGTVPVDQDALVEGDSLPSLGDLSALLANFDGVVQQTELTAQEVAAKLQRHDKLQAQHTRVRGIYDKGVAKIEGIGDKFETTAQRLSNADSWTDDDLAQFVQAGVFTQEYADMLKLFNARIAQHSNNEQLLKTDQGRAALVKMRQGRDQIVAGVQQKLEGIHGKARQRIAAVRSKVDTRYTTRLGSIGGEIDALKENPLVAAELEQRELDAREVAKRKGIAEDLARRKQLARAQEAAAQHQRETLLKVAEALAIIGEMFEKTWKNISAAIDDEKVHAELSALYTEVAGAKKREEKVAVDKKFAPYRDKLATAIIGGKLKSPNDIMPWKMKIHTVHFADALNFLKGSLVSGALKQIKDESQRTVLKTAIQKVEAQVGMLNFFFNGFGSKEESPITRAFEKLHKREIEAKRKRDKEAQRLADIAQKKLSEDISAVVADGGFEVEMSTPKGLVKGAILVEVGQSKKKRDILIISRVAGGLVGVHAGQSSDMTGSSFPQWLQRELGNPEHIKRPIVVAAPVVSSPEVAASAGAVPAAPVETTLSDTAPDSAAPAEAPAHEAPVPSATPEGEGAPKPADSTPKA